MNITSKKRINKQLRKSRVRARVHGTAGRPRLSVFRSLAHTHAQLINDDSGTTLAAASTKELAGKLTKTQAAEEVGKRIAEKAKAIKVDTVVFDRGGNKYHGRVKALADAARAGGLTF